jgi:response regulator NasT
MTGEHTPRARIALAEDHPDVRMAFTRLVERLGHEVIGAVSNGAELLELCRLKEVDVAFVDLDMPVVDGLTAAEEIAERGVPVVLISGHPDAESVVLEHEPFVARIMKPATSETLKMAISRALSTRS